jgi:hypothetical protein
MDGIVAEYPAEIVTEEEIEETDSMIKTSQETDILDVPISTTWDLINTTDLPYIRITWA